jgi:hypothetical protein
MQSIQVAALDTLVDNGYVERDQYGSQIVRRTNKMLASEISERIEELNLEQSGLVEFIQVLASDYGIYGRDGLKSRTGVLEYRYDTV